MNIGIFTDTYLPDINGVVTSIKLLKDKLQENSHNVYIITGHASIVKSSYENNILRLPGVEVKKLYGYIASYPYHIFAIDIIKSMKLDIIHVHTEFGIGIFARIISNKLNIPLVSTYHTTYEDYTHYINLYDIRFIDDIAKRAVSFYSKKMCASVTNIIAPSLKTKKLLESYNITNKINVIPTGIDLDKFNYENLSKDKIKNIRNELEVNDCTSFVFVGRIAKEKSIDQVIDSFNILYKINNKVKLIIVGDGPDLDNLKDKTNKLNLNNCIKFLGKINNSEIAYYYASFDAFISASTTETQGMTYIEALSLGLPIFAKRDKVLDE